MTILKDIYRSFFDKGHEPVWRQFAQETGGIYLPIIGDRVQYRYKDFTITFDAYTHYVVVGGNSYDAEYTRGLVEFICPDNFKLLITQQGFLENISKVFGAQDIKTGNKQLDKKFMIKSNDEAKTLLILSNNSITKLLLENKTVRLDISDGEGLFSEKPGEGNFMLYYVLDEKIKNVDQLNTLNVLFTATLDSLVKNCFIKPAKTNN